MPADPRAWVWLHRTFRLPEHALLMIYRGIFFYGLGRMLSWFLYARLDAKVPFEPVWGGPTFVEGADLSDAGFVEVLIRTAIGGVCSSPSSTCAGCCSCGDCGSQRRSPVDAQTVTSRYRRNSGSRRRGPANVRPTLKGGSMAGKHWADTGTTDSTTTGCPTSSSATSSVPTHSIATAITTASTTTASVTSAPTHSTPTPMEIRLRLP